jgi:hypothetical protein
MPEKPVQLTEDQQEALRTLRDRFNTEANPEYRLAVETVAQARAFRKGIQYGFYSETFGRYMDAARTRIPTDAASDEEIFDFVLNLYAANEEIILGQWTALGMPKTRFLPANPRDTKDASTAQEAESIRDYIHRQPWFNNKRKWQQTEQLFYTDGLILGYARHVRDEKFGTTPKDEIGTVDKGRPAGYDCPNDECQQFTPAEQVKPEMPVCPKCGAAFMPTDLKEAISIPVPQVTGTREVPNGRELADLYGVLETRLPPWCEEVAQFPYAGIETERHVVTMRAKHPLLADKIQPGYVNDAAGQAAAQARAQLNTPPGTQAWAGRGKNAEMITWSLWWFRPEAFYALDPEAGGLRDQLLKLFPNGCRAEWAGPQFLTAVAETMDDHLWVAHALPGDGMYRNGIGTSFLDVAIMVNDAVNIQAEAMEKSSLPPVYRDSGMLGDDAVIRRPSAGADIPVAVAPNKRLTECVWQPKWQEPGSTVRDTLQLGQQMGEVLTGAMPVLAGGSEENLRTARGYGQAQSSAQQRIGTPIDAAKGFWAQMDTLLVREFLANRTDEPVSYSVPSDKGLQVEARDIQPGQAKGAFTYVEAEGAFNSTWNQKAVAITGMMQSGNPAILSWLTAPQNLTVLKQAYAIPELVIPGEEYQKRTLRIISQLLKQDPIMPPPPTMPPPGPPGAGPALPIEAEPAGAPVMPGPGPVLPGPPPRPRASIPLDPLLDDPAQVVQTVRDWCVDPDGGVKAEEQFRSGQSKGWLNVWAYGMDAKDELAQQQMAAAAAMPPMPPSKEKPKGGPPPEKPPLPPPGGDQPSMPMQGAV